MIQPSIRRLGQRIRTTEAVAVAGVVYVLLDLAARRILASIPDLDDPDLVEWFRTEGNQEELLLALNLASVSTVAFLWFVAVIRRRVGDREDQFFATVFSGSGIILIVSTLLATSAAASPAVGARLLGIEEVDEGQILAANSLAGAVSLVIAPRMQAVFVFATSTVVLRSRALPAWVARLGYVFGAAMFVTPFITEPLGVAFPIWVLLVSIVVFIARPPQLADKDPAATG